MNFSHSMITVLTLDVVNFKTLVECFKFLLPQTIHELVLVSCLLAVKKLLPFEKYYFISKTFIGNTFKKEISQFFPISSLVINYINFIN